MNVITSSTTTTNCLGIDHHAELENFGGTKSLERASRTILAKKSWREERIAKKTNKCLGKRQNYWSTNTRQSCKNRYPTRWPTD